MTRGPGDDSATVRSSLSTTLSRPPQHAGAACLGCFKTILDSDKVGSGPVHYWSCIEVRTSTPVCTPRTKGTLQRCGRDSLPTVPLWAVCSGRSPSVTSDLPPRFCHVLEHHFDVPWERAYTPTYGMMMMLVLFYLQACRAARLLFCPKHADEALWRRYFVSCKCENTC